MYRELSYIACILGASAFGTELIYRFKPSNDLSTVEYRNQSDVVLGATTAEIIFSLYTLKFINLITAKRMKLITVIVIGALCTAIILRSKFGMFLTISGNKYNLYNATSFFICLVTVTWVTFWFFKKETPLEDLPSVPLTEVIRRRADTYENRLGNSGTAVTRSGDNHYLREDEEILPSYYELPIPPAYTKINIPNVPVLQAAHSSRPSHDTTSITDGNTNNTSNSQIPSQV